MDRRTLLMIGSGEKSPDVLYATGFSSPDDIVCFVCGSRRAMLASALEFDRAKGDAAKGVEVFPDDEYGRDFMTRLLEIARRHAPDGFAVPRDFPVYWADRLRESGVEVTTVERPFPKREFKTVREIRMISDAELATQTAMMRARDIIADSSVSKDGTLEYGGRTLTSERLRFEIDMRLAELGYRGDGTICAGGLQASRPHERGTGPLHANEPVVIDIFPRSGDTGYFGDMTRTFVKGKAPGIVKKAHRAICEAKRLGISLIGIGAIPSEIHAAASAVLEKAGFATGRGADGYHGFFHSLGHGVGLEIHEMPRLSPNNSVPLRGGEAVTVEPGLYYPGWGGVRQEDLVMLTKSGCLVAPVTMDDTLEID